MESTNIQPIIQEAEIFLKLNKEQILQANPEISLVTKWDSLLTLIQEDESMIDSLITELIQNGTINFSEAQFLLISFQTRNAIPQKAIIIIPGVKPFETNIITGTEEERGIDITKLRAKTGCTTFDPSFGNTSSCESEITFVDGENGILHYRGYPIEELARHSTFVETSFLLMNGELPSEEERAAFSLLLRTNAMLHEDLKNHFAAFPPHGSPMEILSAIVNTMGAYETKLATDTKDEQFMSLAANLMSKIRTIAANTYNQSEGRPLNYPDPDLKYTANFLHMMFSIPHKRHEQNETASKALDLVLLLSADHEQNCSTSTVRLVGSAGSNLTKSIAAGINALAGPKHGGANAKVIDMLETISNLEGGIDAYLELVREKDEVLYGFGHRVYKTFDPRAVVLKEAAEKLLKELEISDPLFELANQLEKRALEDEYFKERNLYPNVDFYSGIILKALNIPTNMFPVIFAMGRLPGWISHWREQHLDKTTKIGRPRQIYTGEPKRCYPLKEESI